MNPDEDNGGKSGRVLTEQLHVLCLWSSLQPSRPDQEKVLLGVSTDRQTASSGGSCPTSLRGSCPVRAGCLPARGLGELGGDPAVQPAGFPKASVVSEQPTACAGVLDE